MSAKKIVIVGGGHAGIELARRLDSHAEVTLVDDKDCFVHTPAAIRAVTDSALLDKLIIPYSNLLKHGTIIQGWVERLEQDAVVLSDGRKLPADITVVATGSSYAAPFKATRAGLNEFRATSARAAASIKEAATIAVVGAGPVGAELAGEIAQAYPVKTVHLITDETSLFPQYTPKLAGKLLADFSSLGVQVHTGKRVEHLESVSEPYAGTVTLPGGERIEADLVFPVIGARPQSTLLESVEGVSTAADGRIEHDGWMRPSKSHPTLFAVGDVLASGDAMTIVAITRQVPWLEKTIKAVLAGKPVESSKPYTPWPLAPIILPLGPSLGATALPFGKKGMAVGHWLTSRMKGRDLFITKYRKMLGQS
jgi:apoptosis-inducing factor 2